MSCVIIGGGVSGLYAGVRILQDINLRSIYTSVHVLETNARVGGRVYTAKHKGVLMEAGAGRFNKNHVRFWNLLKKYDLEKDAVPIAPKKVYVKDGVLQKKFDVDVYLKQIANASTKYSESYLRSVSFKTFMYDALSDAPPSFIDDIIYAFGYNTELEDACAYETLHALTHDFREDVQYYGLKGGLSKVTDALAKEFLELGGHLHLSTHVTHVSKKDQELVHVTVQNIDKSKHVYENVKHVIFCVPIANLQKIQGDFHDTPGLQNTIHMLGTQELLRVYAKFDTPWFTNIQRTTTNDMIRYIIPIDPINGIIMISYTDGRHARYLATMPEKVKNETIMKHVRKVFPHIEIPNPKWMQSYYWEEGAHYWKFPLQKKHMKITNSDHYLFAGEAFSIKNHAWIEGALDSVDNIMCCLQ